jgi:phosphoribosylamine--glycine ligase
VRILIVGGGGREHAIAWALHRDTPDATLYCAPGNPGTEALATNLSINATDLDRLADAADAYGIDLTVIGPEAPLAIGLADRLRAEGCTVFGPGQAAAQIEASKAFAKEVMTRAGVPTADSRSFTGLADALSYIDRQREPLVVKASGLAAGKGAIVCATRGDARQAATAMLGEGKFGEAGRVVVVEEFLEGEELSVLGVTNGEGLVLLPPAQDHKRLDEGDTGPNTGGMGAYSPVSLGTPALLERVEREVFRPTLAQLARDGAPYNGVLYAGLMIEPDGTPRVIEFNCRLGDPETQAILPLIEDGLTECLWQVAKGNRPTGIRTAQVHAVTTVLAARGYPDKPETGAAITIPERLPDGVTVFHAGTRRDPDGTLRTGGGRVLNVTAVASSLSEAQARSRETATAIEFEGKVFRRDIGWREAARQKLGV